MENRACTFGVGDLHKLVIRPELLARKFDINYQPAAFFCLYEEIRKRSLDVVNQKRFNAEFYSQLPQVQLLHGKELEEVKFFF
jgi:hypothetical protein